MDRAIQSIAWRAPGADLFADVTDAVENGLVSSTPHPDPEIDRPKGYSITLTLKPDSTAFAEALQEALVAFDPAAVSLRLEGVDEDLEEVPVGVSKVPHLGERNDAELSVKPEGHALFHPHFSPA